MRQRVAGFTGRTLVLLELLLAGRGSLGRQLGAVQWHAGGSTHATTQRQPEQPQQPQQTYGLPVEPSVVDPSVTTEAIRGKQCEYRCHFDWFGNCGDPKCTDCVGCVQMRAPRAPPRPKAPPPPTPLMVPRPLWCSDLSARGDALMQKPPLFCYQLAHEACSKFYVRYHGISVPCQWLAGECQAAPECMDAALSKDISLRRPPPSPPLP